MKKIKREGWSILEIGLVLSIIGVSIMWLLSEFNDINQSKKIDSSISKPTTYVLDGSKSYKEGYKGSGSYKDMDVSTLFTYTPQMKVVSLSTYTDTTDPTIEEDPSNPSTPYSIDNTGASGPSHAIRAKRDDIYFFIVGANTKTNSNYKDSTADGVKLCIDLRKVSKDKNYRGRAEVAFADSVKSYYSDAKIIGGKTLGANVASKVNAVKNPSTINFTTEEDVDNDGFVCAYYQ